MSNYLIDYSGWSDEGGYCQVYPIKDKQGWVFKEFKNKKKAQESLGLQKKLARYDLAPQVYSQLCRLHFMPEDGYSPNEPSDWGYITERAYPVNHNDKTMKDIQYLVENIHSQTGLKFWDCHWYNVGIIKRDNTKKLVCIDTGKESFNGIANAWGFSDPGPKCSYCNRYQCKCSED
jgi:hypothetical protein